MKIKDTYKNLPDHYLFAKISEKVNRYASMHPGTEIISLGIGDVTQPLPPSVIEAGNRALADLASSRTFRGYGPYAGYEFLKNAIAGHYRNRYQIHLDPEEISIGAGAKDDMANVLDLFSQDNDVLITDPVYPAYLDVHRIDGRNISLIDAHEGNGFVPVPDQGKKSGIIHLCSPNNPTGSVLDRQALSLWVDYAIANNAVIIFDAAYERYIQEGDLPHSIFEIPGARQCAIEFCSLSKTAGFTGVRCGYTIIPKELSALRGVWKRRAATKTNGVSYLSQRMAEAVFTEQGQAECRALIDYYMEQAHTIAAALDRLGVPYYGAKNAPYIWLKCGGSSWAFFDRLLQKCNVVGAPGAGFGQNGEGWFRLTAFNTRERTAEAIRRLETDGLFV